MKYTAISAAALVSLVPSSFAGKPDHKCAISNEEPPFQLGGYNVPLSQYGGFSQEKGVAMVNDLWRKALTSMNTATIMPAKDFDPVTLSGLSNNDTYFAFDKKQGKYRGVGVMGGDSEVSDNEGLYITFGGLETTQVFFGVRALFVEGPNESPVMETGLFTLYMDGEPIDSVKNMTFFEATSNDDDDGQEYVSMISDKPFDAISFITYSHDRFPVTQGNHDYFLEYLDICHTEPSTFGDPHVRTWSGAKYDFHGVCDLVLLKNSEYENGLGMDIHVRTKQVKQFSYISSAVLRIGDDTLEVMGDLRENLYWINGEANGDLAQGISGYAISSRKVNSKQYEFVVDLGEKKSIVLKTYNKFVRVNIKGALKEDFGSSLGLLGSFESGKLIARDSQTILEDVNEFGQEWQVLPSEAMLFHNVEGPQAPEKCYIPVATNLRRRLAESVISEREAEVACAGVSPSDFDLCVFDVMATGDGDVAGAY